jgi:thioredoxin-dependent peroxiredoxin
MKGTALVMITLSILTMKVSAGNQPVAGTSAPLFTLTDADGKSHTLSDYKGSYVALYFYPKDNTPGCTKEACNLRDNFEVLKEKSIVILGVSYDSEASHGKFRDKYDLPFPLLADVDKKVSELYGVKGMFGPKRVTFIISPDAVITHVITKVKTADHAAQIMDAIESLSQENR